MKSLILLSAFILLVSGVSHYKDYELQDWHRVRYTVYCWQIVLLYERICAKKFRDDEKKTLRNKLSTMCCDLGCSFDSISKICDQF